MKQDEFDLRLTQEMADLPPDPNEIQDYNPWQAAMSKILWGMALTTFRLEFFYLQYLLPLLGAAPPTQMRSRTTTPGRPPCPRSCGGWH